MKKEKRGNKESNKFDIYVPADDSKESYGLSVYIHAGEFTTGDKLDDASILQWLCSRGYVKVCPFDSVKHLANALEENGVTLDYFELPHSCHTLQNDTKLYGKYMEKVTEYLERYMPV